MNSHNNYIACTVMMRDINDRTMFLVCKGSKACSFPTTETESQKTALANAINQLKELINLDVDSLELAELTNAVVREEHVPLYVFTYENLNTNNKEVIIKNNDKFEWVYYNELVTAFEEWKIEGVPQLFNSY